MLLNNWQWKINFLIKQIFFSQTLVTWIQKRYNLFLLNKHSAFLPIFTLQPTLEAIEFLKIFNLFTIIFVISLILFGLAYFLSLSTIKDSEKLSQYECGFEPFDEATRHPFDVHFYVVGILFLIFDVEIALLFPWVLGLKFSNWFGFFYNDNFFRYFNDWIFLWMTQRCSSLTS